MPGSVSSASKTNRRVRGLLLLLATVVALLVAYLWAGAGADDVFDGKAQAQTPLADTVAARSLAHGDGPHLSSASSRLNGQAQVAIDQMTLLGLGQVVARHPEFKARYLPAMEAAAQRLVDPATLTYAGERYGRHGLDGPMPTTGHAYLGYINLGLGMLRLLEPEHELAGLHDRLSAMLAVQLLRAPRGMLETYPGEIWPPDVAVVAGSVGLHGQVTGTDHGLAGWAERFATCAVDASSGYLVQRLASGSCEALDAPRGSGTALAAYALGFVKAPLSRRLFAALQVHSRRGLGGAAVREYAPGFSGRGDVNAGPILFGFSVGATGFALGAARTHGDRDLFVRLYRTASIFGGRVDRGPERRFLAGGRLGDALLLAMVTAEPST